MAARSVVEADGVSGGKRSTVNRTAMEADSSRVVMAEVRTITEEVNGVRSITDARRTITEADSKADMAEGNKNMAVNGVRSTTDARRTITVEDSNRVAMGEVRTTTALKVDAQLEETSPRVESKVNQPRAQLYKAD
jgi:hypothetical protein